MSLTLSKHELEVMSVLWDADHPLTHAEILARSTGRSWRTSTLYNMLKNLIDKGAIEIVGSIPSGKVSSGTYSPVITRQEFSVTQIERSFPKTLPKKQKLLGVFSTLVKYDEVDLETLQELQQMIEDKKKELNG